MGLTGTCELQICRSAGPWSMGTPDRIEFSIQNAYLKGGRICMAPTLTHLTSCKLFRCLIISYTSRTNSSSHRKSNICINADCLNFL